MKKFIILAFMAMFPSLAHSAGQIEISNPPNANGQALTPNTVTANSVSAATVTALENGATFGAFPATPMFFACNTNGYCQHVGQNLSNGTGASGDFVITNDLGGDTSFYINLGINSSKFSQASQPLSLSSAGYLTTADGGLVIQSGLNGNLNGGTYNGRNSPYIQIVSSVSNVMADISTTAWTIPSNSTFSIAGNAFSVGGSTASLKGNLVVTTSGTYILGDTSGANAPAGYVGEFISTTPTVAANLGPTGVFNSISTTTLTPGDWDVSGMAGLNNSGSFAGTVYGACISLTPNGCDSVSFLHQESYTGIASDVEYLPTPVRRILVTVNTAVYLTARVTYTVNGGSTFDTTSNLRARRMR